jgi:hypothetical protein
MPYTVVTQYNGYIELHKNRWFGDVLAGEILQFVYKNVKCN